MKGLILGGGRGTRLYPLTATTNKHLLPVGSQPLIRYVVDQLLDANVEDILLLIDQLNANQYMSYFEDGKKMGIKSLAYIWQSPEGKGLPVAIGQAENFIQDEKLIVACGDVIIEDGIGQAVDHFAHQPKGARIIATYMEDTAGYSLLKVSDTHVEGILPKDKQRHVPGLIDLGVYMYYADVFEMIRGLRPSERGEKEIWDLNNNYIRQGELQYTTVSGWWSDVGGSLENYFKAHERYDE